MVYPRCLRLDVLANRLMEIYRTEDAFFVGSSAGYSPMAEIYIAIRDHKKGCIPCQKIAEAHGATAAGNTLTTSLEADKDPVLKLEVQE